MATKLVNGKRVEMTAADIASLPTEADRIASVAKEDAAKSKKQKDVSDVARKVGVTDEEFRAAVKAAIQG